MTDKNSLFRQIGVVSGKGGTGKTTLVAALAALAGKLVVADADVDAADLHILLKPSVERSYPYVGGKKAFIDLLHCTQCGICEKHCRFKAIRDFHVDLLACEGCGFCVQLCPENCIDFKEVVAGFYHEGIFPGGELVDAALQPGEGNSGKLVSQVKKRAEELLTTNKRAWLIVDGPPGIGCPVNASLSGADLVLIVTEPTVSGLHDPERLVQLIHRFDIPAGVIINKADLNSRICSQIISYSENEGIPVLGRIPFDEQVITTLLQKKIITDFPDSPATMEIVKIYDNIINFFETKAVH